MDSNSPPTAPTQNGNTPSGPSSFDRVPTNILGDILRYVLVFDRKPVHVVSRLDPFYSPDFSLVSRDGDNVLDAQGTSLRLLHRFHIGNGSFSLTCEMPPRVLLAPLAVCHQWHYIGCNLFYSLNKFCFSSIGE